LIGQTLAQFRITAKLGEGGMGEVYRAEDTKLGREVAIKVLPVAVAEDPQRLARFEREAQVLASLNHPNIAGIHQVEEAEGRHFLVMELVEGEDLQQRLERGAVPVDDAIPIALQIAQALEAAHESGIIHRDLKPANVKVKPNGEVKVLDFGLAKALDPQEATSGSRALSMSPTLTAQMTQAGVLLGTAAYMSPEQARGQEVDKRADVWAFGVLLWEMLGGRQLFVGDTVSDTLAEVLKTEPDLSVLPNEVSPPIRRLLNRCLTREAKDRLRDIGEARIVLEQYDDDGPFPPEGEEPNRRTPNGRVANVVVLAAAIAALGAWFMARWTAEPPSDPPGFSFLVSEPKGIMTGSLAISPDGSRLAFVALGEDTTERLWIRPLDSFSARPLPDTEGARRPFWSPDGREIAFFVHDELLRIAIDAAGPRRIATVPGSIGGTWGPDGTILVGNSKGPIQKVAASGGVAPSPALELTESEGPAVSHGWPEFLPDGRQYVFLSDGAGGTDGLDHRLAIGVLGESESRTLIRNLRSPAIVDPRGWILFGQNNQIVAQQMDFASATLIGDPYLVADGVFTTDQFHKIPAAVSSQGSLAFQSGTGSKNLVWRDETGTLLGTVDFKESMTDPRISPDGQALAVEIPHSSDERTVWILDLERGVRTQLSDRGMLSDSPAWSPDGRWVYFNTAEGDGWRTYRQPREGSPTPDLVFEEAFGDLTVADISPDGRWLLFGALKSDPSWNLWILRLDIEDAEPSLWLEGPENYQIARFSNDSRWIAYASDDRDRGEVFIRGVEGNGRRWQISSAGGTDPVWSRDGSSLFYISRDRQVMSVPIEIRDNEVIAGAPRELFRQPNLAPGSFWRNVFDQAPDGRLLFVERSDESTNAIHVQTIWRPE
jgi:serine/threonine protein kinase